jgi:hypothetical protein
MSPAVAADPPIGQVVAAVALPAWYAPPADNTPVASLMLRHPGLGWMAFAFEKAEARKIGNYLVAQSMN